MINHYEVLGISRNATSKQIKQKFRTLVGLYNPLRGTTPDIATYIKISQSYQVLNQPSSKTAYDIKLSDFELTSLRTESLTLHSLTNLVGDNKLLSLLPLVKDNSTDSQDFFRNTTKINSCDNPAVILYHYEKSKLTASEFVNYISEYPNQFLLWKDQHTHGILSQTQWTDLAVENQSLAIAMVSDSVSTSFTKENLLKIALIHPRVLAKIFYETRLNSKFNDLELLDIFQSCKSNFRLEVLNNCKLSSLNYLLEKLTDKELERVDEFNCLVGVKYILSHGYLSATFAFLRAAKNNYYPIHKIISCALGVSISDLESYLKFIQIGGLKDCKVDPALLAILTEEIKLYLFILSSNDKYNFKDLCPGKLLADKLKADFVSSSISSSSSNSSNSNSNSNSNSSTKVSVDGLNEFDAVLNEARILREIISGRIVKRVLTEMVDMVTVQAFRIDKSCFEVFEHLYLATGKIRSAISSSSISSCISSGFSLFSSSFKKFSQVESYCHANPDSRVARCFELAKKIISYKNSTELHSEDLVLSLKTWEMLAKNKTLQKLIESEYHISFEAFSVQSVNSVNSSELSDYGSNNHRSKY